MTIHTTLGKNLALALVVACAWGAEAEVSSSAPASDRVRQTMTAALEQAPAVATRQRMLARRETVETEARPSGIALEWQTEGVGSGLDREPNAIDSLRLRKEIVLFGQRSKARSYRRQASQTLEAVHHVTRLELAAGAGDLWLDLAAAQDHRALVRHRLERLEQALRLHRKRLELGEVPGIAVRQLDVQKARGQAELAELELELEDLAGRLLWRAGEVPQPGEGDLAELAGELGEVPLEDLTAAPSPYVDAVRSQALTAEKRSELVRATAWGLTEAEMEVQRIPTIDGAEPFETFGFRIAVPLPWGKQGRSRRAAAELEAEAARADGHAAEQEVRRRVDLALARARAAEELLAATSAVMDDLPRNERSLAEQFRLGAITYLVYIDGLSRLDELRADLIDARRTLLKARLELGTLLADPEIFPIPTVPEET